MINGTAYGVILNDRDELLAMDQALNEKPYNEPPVAPVLYIKPRNTFANSGSQVTVPEDISEVVVAGTLCLLFGDQPGVPVGAALVIDIFEPHESYYRPAIKQKCRDGFLPVGAFRSVEEGLDRLVIQTEVDGVEVHQWCLDRLNRDPGTLVNDVNDFMTLSDGDVLILGLPGDAPKARAGQKVTVSAPGFKPVTVMLKEVDQ